MTASIRVEIQIWCNLDTKYDSTAVYCHVSW